MEQNLIGYLLDALDERSQRQVETYLQQHPAAQDHLAVVMQALAPLGLDDEAPAPPPALAVRTLATIAAHICEEPAPIPISDLPVAPPVSSSTAVAGRPWWRRADALVAACLLFTVTGLCLTVAGRLQGPSSAALIVSCQHNLHHFFVGLQQYRDVHGEFPDITKQSPHSVAGMVVPMLLEAGTLPAEASVRCPGNGPPMACTLTPELLRDMSDVEFARRSPSLSLCYAYSLGYRDDDGVFHVPGAGPGVSLSQLPIMADRPPSEGAVTNSVNHGGTGQNVLFSDGHVVFLTDRKLGDDDIFLNNDRRVLAGVDAADVVLGYSAARPW